jgi:hypothetical protein
MRGKIIFYDIAKIIIINIFNKINKNLLNKKKLKKRSEGSTAYNEAVE